MKLLTKIACEKRIANAKAAAAAETSGNDTDIIVTPKEYIPHHTGDNRPSTIATDDSTQLKPPPHIDNDDGLRRIATDDSTQLQELNAGIDDETRTIDTENSAQLKPTTHIDSDDGTRTIDTENSLQLKPKSHIAKEVTRKRGAVKIALHSSMASPSMTQHLHDIAWHYISMARAILHSMAQPDRSGRRINSSTSTVRY